VRTPFIAGNWKMHLDRAGAIALASGIAKAEMPAGVDVAVCPPSPYLSDVVQATAGSKVGVGGQNCHFEAQGAFTGEVATAMLVDVGCRYVILGHSERRQLFGETDAGVLAKAKAALGVGLIPIICVGETLEEREAGRTFEVVRGQCDGSIGGLTEAEAAKIVIAYEPVWAIGTGRTATAAQAQEAHAFLRGRVAAKDANVAAALPILYGGSVKAGNAAELFAMPDVDGGLIGGASLVAEDFVAIGRAAAAQG